MAFLRRFLLRLSNAWHPRRAESDLDRELASHLRLLQDEFERRGRSPEEATLAAAPGVPPIDPVAFSAASVLSIAVGVAVSYLTRRATRLDAMEALRYE